MKVIFRRDIPLLPLKDAPKIGALYHTSWARKTGMVWRCIAINEQEQTVTLQTPKTKKILSNIKISDLRHTRSAQAKLIKDGRVNN